MDEKEIKNNIPCIVDNGIIYNIKDMQRVLRDLGHVQYFQLIDDEIKATGEGYIVSVVTNNHSANIFVNRRIYINLNGFEYMVIKTENGQSSIDLIDHSNVIRLLPITNPLTEEIPPGEVVLSQVAPYSDEEYDEAYVEINVDDDFDDE